MDFFELVEKRRSVRKFTGEEVPDAVIAKILKAALGAPSSKNCRSSSFMVVEKPELIEKISQMRDMGSAFMKHAPLVILVMGDPSLTDLWVDNAAISATYLQLAAGAAGLGSCWVHVNGRPRLAANPDGESSEEYLKTFLPVPEGRRILCAVAAGYPAQATAPHASREPESGKVIKA